MNAISRYLASRDNRALHLVLGLGSALGVWGLRMPGFDLGFLAAAAILFLLAAVLISARIIVRAIFAWKREPGGTRVFEGALTWRLFLYATGVLVVLGSYGLPFKAALALSRPNLDRFAATSAAGQHVKAPHWLGLFSFKSIHYQENHVQLTFRKSEFPWGERGLYYSFSGRPIDSSHFHSQESLGGGWYKWHYGGW